MTITRRGLGAVLTSAMLVATTGPLMAQADFPTRPITYVIPFNPGGESDVTARFQQPFMEEILGQSVVIQSRPGAGGATAWAQLNSLEADGHTIMNTIVPHTILQPAMKDVGYQTADIENVYFFHYTPDAILVPADSPFQTLQDLIDFATENPGALTMGGSGTNTANHLASVIFGDLTGATVTYVPFSGSAPAMTAVLGGQIGGAMSYTTQAVKAGDQVRALAVATEERVPALPDVPTFLELGIDHVGGAYRGVAVPAGTPDEIKQRLSDVIGEVNADPEFQRQMTEAGYQVVDIPLGEIPAFIENRRAAYATAIERMGGS
ncbi:Bug family tripartite tricarboxylate transporter substrate binding protein [Jannaschia aquimarina]|uniref:Tripartite tricarboxylate transporter family receptor n=1 Tax=Jannaschia aquimarina TaxID=935700 RepID=A0A0D1EKE7_9RHOB|nr:tripartite tricarboxylate transporter substrate binding protein [Jannaschia aquimarina]KIT16245.1 Tripartite tricarboxylate transporter family receptor [Jannaschia aquimarina]SNT15382.1 Tripartite-type tricarboxylate transporter, receptor component TctC [Jannaschia aquimarina]